MNKVREGLIRIPREILGPALSLDALEDGTELQPPAPSTPRCPWLEKIDTGVRNGGTAATPVGNGQGVVISRG